VKSSFEKLSGTEPCAVAESPIWDDETRMLYWVDIIGKSVFRCDVSGASATVWKTDDFPTAIALTSDPDHAILAMAGGLCDLDFGSGKTELLCAPDGMAGNRLNEGKCDPQGRFWVGSMQTNLNPDGSGRDMDRNSGALFRIDGNYGVSRQSEHEFGISNTLAWSPDHRTLYFGDTIQNVIFAYDFDPDDGVVGARRVLDLSVGSVFAFSPMLMVIALDSGLPLGLAMTVGLTGAAMIGLVNAFITLKLGLPSFIATLGMLFMARSLAIVISGGFPPPFPRDIDLWWIVGNVDLLKVSIFWLLGIGILLGWWLRSFDFGSWIYATGGNQEAARDMGINTVRVKAVCFVLCSVLAGFAGMIQTFRIKAIVPTMGTGFELTAIAAAVIGGAALTGGIGSVIGAVIGALLIAFIENIIILTRIDANWFRFAVGAMIVIAVTINKVMRDYAARQRRKVIAND